MSRRWKPQGCAVIPEAVIPEAVTPESVDLIVVPDSVGVTGCLKGVDRRGRVVTGPFMCALGRGGVRLTKREGDGATPIGRFPLRRCFYRPDRESAPETRLPVVPIGKNDGWGDDPADPDGYNRAITLPRSGGHERMWREDALYDLVLVPGHNDDPPIPGAGSAIFIHVARAGYPPTEGCVALAPEALRAILGLCGPGSALTVLPPSCSGA